jgi:hypothetical protein
MKIIKLAVISASAAGLLLPTIARAQETVRELSYENSLGCLAAYSLMQATAEEGSEDAALLEDVLTRWSFMAVTRDGEEGARAMRETETAIGGLIGELDAFGEDQAAAEGHFNGVVGQCLALQASNQAEFDAIDVDAVNAPVGAESAAEETK